VRQFGSRLSRAKTDEPIEMMFGDSRAWPQENWYFYPPRQLRGKFVGISPEIKSG